MWDVVVAGDVNPDLVLAGVDPDLRFGQREALVDGADLVPGGSAGITACALARLGLRVALIGTVGDDDLGRLTIAALAREGVDVGRVRPVPDRASGISVHLMAGHDRAILTSTGSMAAVAAGDVDDELLDRARHLHLAGLFLLDGLRAGAAGLLDRARAAGCSTSLDPNWDPTGRWDLAGLLGGVDVLLPNEAEAGNLARCGQVDQAAAILGAMVGTVAIKRGTDPALAWSGGHQVRLDPPAATVEVDAIGAGDCFDAGFLAARLDGRPLERCLALGLALGTLSLAGPGGTGAPWTADQAEALAASLVP